MRIQSQDLGIPGQINVSVLVGWTGAQNDHEQFTGCRRAEVNSCKTGL